jgi:hypothetical protein
MEDDGCGMATVTMSGPGTKYIYLVASFVLFS